MHGLAPCIAALQVLDLDILISTAAGDRALARELLTIFVATAEPIFRRLAAAMEAGDCAASRHESHAMAGAAGLIGASAIIPILKEIEVLAFRRHHESVASRMPALALAFAPVMAAVVQALENFDASGEAAL